jgi:hypothetical protein
MEFYLTYDGRLPASGGEETVKVKHEIRKSIHRQLAELWDTRPELQALGNQLVTLSGYPGQLHYIDAAAMTFAVDDFRFVPLVTGDLNLLCHLDILFLRRDDTTALITKPKDEYGGDLDNRLKIFLDALRIPNNKSELPRGSAVDADESPYFFCLVQDDSLISKFQLEGAKLLVKPSAQPTAKDAEKHVRLVVKVTVKTTMLTMQNMSFLSG